MGGVWFGGWGNGGIVERGGMERSNMFFLLIGMGLLIIWWGKDRGYFVFGFVL